MKKAILLALSVLSLSPFVQAEDKARTTYSTKSLLTGLWSGIAKPIKFGGSCLSAIIAKIDLKLFFDRRNSYYHQELQVESDAKTEQLKRDFAEQAHKLTAGAAEVLKEKLSKTEAKLFTLQKQQMLAELLTWHVQKQLKKTDTRLQDCESRLKAYTSQVEKDAAIARRRAKFLAAINPPVATSVKKMPLSSATGQNLAHFAIPCSN